MNIQFNRNNTISIIMKNYLEEIFSGFGEDVIYTTTSSLKNKITTIDESSERFVNRQG